MPDILRNSIKKNASAYFEYCPPIVIASERAAIQVINKYRRALCMQFLSIVLCLFSLITHAADQASHHERNYHAPKGKEQAPATKHGFFKEGDIICVALENSAGSDDEQVPPSVIPFDRFFCDAAATALVDDAEQSAKLRIPVFVQLCVQAAKIEGPQAVSVRELLFKIKNEFELGTAQPSDYWHSTDWMYITPKDLEHRLLSAIPAKNDHFYPVLVNGQELILYLDHRMTDADKRENARRKQAAPPKQYRPRSKREWGMGIEPPKPRYIKQYSGRLLRAQHSFEENEEHHAKIVQEFEQLLSQQ